MIAIDNVLSHGDVTRSHPGDTAEDIRVRSIQALNTLIRGDARVEISMVPVSDGVTLCWKKPAQP